MNFVLRRIVWPLVISILPFIAMARADDAVRLTNGEWPPYFSEEMKNGGLGSQIVREAFELAGKTVEYGYYPWKRAYVLAETGHWDGSVLWGWSEERQKAFYISDPVFEAREVFFYRRDETFDWDKLDDLHDLRIAGNVGYFYGPDFHAAADAEVFKLDLATSAVTSIKKLLAGRVDAYIDDEIVGLHVLHSQFGSDQAAKITVHPKAVWVTPLYLLLSRKKESNAETIKAFNLGLRRLRQSGRYYQLLAQATNPNGS